VSESLDGTFAQSVASPSVSLQGSFVDATYLSGTYLADVSGSFVAVGDASVIATTYYKFTGSITVTRNDTTTSSASSRLISFGMDDSNQVSGSASLGADSLAGTVSGSEFTGTVSYLVPYEHHFTTIAIPVSGTYSNTASGVTLDGQYIQPDGSVVTFSTVGCRANCACVA